MKSTKIAVSILVIAVAFMLGSFSAFAFGIPSIPGVGSKGGGSTANAADVVKDTRNSLYSFTSAELGLLQAIGGYEQLAAQQELLNGMRAGDAAASQEQIETLKNIHTSAQPALEKKVAENAKIDASQKALASKSMVEYVKGLVSTKNLVGSIQGLAKNPMAIGSDAGAVLYAAKEVPGVVTGGTSTTGTLIKYLTANGVDTSEAQKAADDLGK